MELKAHIDDVEVILTLPDDVKTRRASGRSAASGAGATWTMSTSQGRRSRAARGPQRSRR